MKVALLSPQLSPIKPRVEYIDEVSSSEIAVKYMEKEGRLEFLVRLRPGARQVIEFGYEVSCPANEIIEGMYFGGQGLACVHVTQIFNFGNPNRFIVTPLC